MFETLLFLAIFSGPPVLRGRDLTASLRNEFDLASGIQVFVWLLGLGWIIGIVLGGKGFFPKLGIPQMLGILLAFVLGLSALFSPAPALTMFRSLQVFIAILFSFKFVRKYGWESAVRLLFFGLVMLMLGLFVANFLAPDLVVKGEGEQYARIRGDWLAPAAPVALCMLIFLLLNPTKISHKLRIILVVLSICLLVLARNRTGYVVVATLGAVSILTINKKWSLFWKFAVFAVLLGISISLTIGWETVAEWVIRNPNQIRTLSARVVLWSDLVQQVMNDSPILGLGYVASSRVLGPQAVPGLGHAHSAFVEVLVGGGLIALSVYVAIWMWIVVKSTTTVFRGDQYDFTLMSLLITVFIFSLTNSYGITVSPVSFTFWLVLAAWHRKHLLAIPRSARLGLANPSLYHRG
jgi:hypothetical protein